MDCCEHRLVLVGNFPIRGHGVFSPYRSRPVRHQRQGPSGSRLEVTNQYIARVENDIHQVIGPHDLGMIVSNIGITPDLSAMYTSNSSMDTAFVQVSLKEDHKFGSYEYMRRVRRKLSEDLPELDTYFQAGGLVDAVINWDYPRPSMSKSEVTILTEPTKWPRASPSRSEAAKA